MLWNLQKERTRLIFKFGTLAPHGIIGFHSHSFKSFWPIRCYKFQPMTQNLSGEEHTISTSVDQNPFTAYLQMKKNRFLFFFLPKPVFQSYSRSRSITIKALLLNENLASDKHFSVEIAFFVNGLQKKKNYSLSGRVCLACMTAKLVTNECRNKQK